MHATLSAAMIVRLMTRVMIRGIARMQRSADPRDEGDDNHGDNGERFRHDNVSAA